MADYSKDFSANSIKISPDRGLRPLTACPKGLPRTKMSVTMGIQQIMVSPTKETDIFLRGLSPTLLTCPVENCDKMKPAYIDNEYLINTQHFQRDENGVNDFLFGGGGDLPADLSATVLTTEEASAEAEKNKGKIHQEFSPSDSDFSVRNIQNGSPTVTLCEQK